MIKTCSLDAEVDVLAAIPNGVKADPITRFSASTIATGPGTTRAATAAEVDT
jgi:hypothetical protein